ncbi:hypothetical protein GQF03_16870 [Sneathiella chungangensis]|uniref:Branched-chain amino acid ABC transporter permease n=1 Tax=Sneathiella chungangensis TaxID=1418234 RepID=A0A845ML61_9PROT|nr:branched-chain amino acid ABC transporter permease [Sneathiella chungangensis]MZR24010.1 hypothetical protein [Sneathiella chungangensis]
MLYVFQQLLNAVQVTAIYALLSAAFVLFYGVTNRINLAFGAIAMWAAYVTIMMISLLEGVTFWPLLAVVLAGVVIALANTTLLGFSLHHLALRRLVARPVQAMLIATIAIAIVLEETMRLINNSRELWLRPIFADPVSLAGAGEFPVQITALQIVAVTVAFAVVVMLILLMKRHRFGVYWRACAEDLHMAALCGANIPLILAASFVLASLAAALGGSLIALLYGSASFVMGTVIGLKTMFIAVIGGLRSLTGALIASAALALFETFWSAYLDLAYRDVAAFCALTLVLVLKPEGLRAR